MTERDGSCESAGVLKKLYVQVLIGIVIGILLSVAWPQLGVDMKPLGDWVH